MMSKNVETSNRLRSLKDKDLCLSNIALFKFDSETNLVHKPWRAKSARAFTLPRNPTFKNSDSGTASDLFILKTSH